MWIYYKYYMCLKISIPIFGRLLTESFSLHAPILCVSVGFLSELLCVHIVDIETFNLHGLILYVFEGFLFQLLCIHIVNMGTFGLHGLLLCVSEGFLS